MFVVLLQMLNVLAAPFFIYCYCAAEKVNTGWKSLMFLVVNSYARKGINWIEKFGTCRFWLCLQDKIFLFTCMSKTSHRSKKGYVLNSLKNLH